MKSIKFKETPEETFFNPIGIGLDQNDHIYLSEYTGGKISRFDENGIFLNSFGGGGHAYDLTFDHEGHVLVTDQVKGQIQYYTPEGTFIKSIGEKLTQNEPVLDHYLDGPTCVRIDRTTGNLIIFDNGIRTGPSIKIFDSKGQFVRKIGKPQPGDLPGEALTSKIGDWEIKASYSGDVDGKGNIIIADYELHVVLAFTQEGEPLFRIDTKGKQPGQLDEPQAVVIDQNGNLIITEYANSRISVFG